MRGHEQWLLLSLLLRLLLQLRLLLLLVLLLRVSTGSWKGRLATGAIQRRTLKA
jgi:hypothetical protein